MPEFPAAVLHRIDAAARIVWLEYQGAVTPDLLDQVLRRVFADPAYRPGFGIALDRRQAPLPPATLSQYAATAAQQFAEQLSGARLALIVADTAGYGTARRTQTYLSNFPIPVEIFCHPAEAEEWLRQTDPGAGDSDRAERGCA